MKSKTQRSPAMQKVIIRLAEMERSLSWLGKQLEPSVKRQTVHGWRDVPDHRVREVAGLIGLPAAQVRPDLFAQFAEPSSKRAA